MKKTKHLINRQSGVELLKLCAMFFIVFLHLTPINWADNSYLSIYANRIGDLNNYFINVEGFFLLLARYLGGIGNVVFMICSSYYLCDRTYNNKNKVLRIIIDTTAISIIGLLIFKIGDMPLNAYNVLTSFFPILFCNYWFISAYICLYLMYPYINLVLNRINKTEHASIAIVLFIVYILIMSIFGQNLFQTNLVDFIVIYIVVSYLKKYCNGFMDSRRKNIYVLLLSTTILLIAIIMTNTIIKNFGIFEGELMHWASLHNPLSFGVALSLFGVFRSINIKSGLINKLSSMTIYIYIYDSLFHVANTNDRIISIILNKNFPLTPFVTLFVLTILHLTIYCLFAIIYNKSIGCLTNKLASNVYIRIKMFINKAIEVLDRI